MSKRSLKGGGKGKRVFPAEDNSPLDLQPSCSKCSKINEAMFRNKFEQTDSDNEVQGKVKQILMKNFMNHSTMDIVLNPKVNFIVEHDGNGRSAIITALTIGLGGKAITTSGDSSLREFIKDGADTADIEITLNNSGPFAQKPQEYGKEITISTMISSATGNASYKLKNGYGEIRDIEKEELEKIIWRFKIQIDNPVCILNQDTAEKLLNSRDPEELFGLFLKATSTVALAEACDYVLVRLYSEITRIIPQMKAYQMRKEYKKLKDEMEEQHSLCPKLLAEVEKQQNQMISIKSSLRELDEELITLQRQCSEAEENLKNTKQDARLKNEEYDSTFRTIEILKEEIIGTQDLAQFYESELHKLTPTVAKLTLRELLRQRTMVKKDLKAVKKRNENARRERSQLDEEVTKLRKDHCTLLKQLMNLQDSIEPDTSNFSTLREKSNEYKELLARKTTEYDQLQEKLKELASEQETLKSKCEELTNIITGFERKRRAIVMQKEKLHRELECSEFEKEIHEKKYHDQCNCVHQLQKNLKMMDEGVKKAFNETMPPAICAERSTDETEKELTYIESAQHVTKMYLEKKEEHDMIKEVVSIMKKNLELLELIVKLRFDYYTFELRLVTAAVQHEFQLLLDKHNLKGNVIIDIMKRTLQLAAKFSSSDGHTDGEISYLAVILIISLWNVMESPIYVLNEVDACMHEGYRKQMMDLLVAHAEEAKEKQFIFVIQEDTSNVSPE